MTEWKAVVERALQQCQQAQAQKEQKVWQALLNRLPDAEARPFAILSLLEHLRSFHSPYVQELRPLEEELKQKAEEQTLHYGDLLKQALASEGCTVEGRFPQYRINQIVEVVIEERKRRARVGTRFRAVMIREDISVAAVAEAVRKQLQRLFQRPFQAEGFLQTLWKAYLLALAFEKEALRIGDYANIFTVHKFIVWLKQKDVAFFDAEGKKFVPYLPDEFAVDLGRLLEKGVTQTEQGYCLHLTPVRNPKEALFVVNFKTKTGQNYGLLQFRSEQKEV